MKQIIVDSKNGAENIRLSRLASRKSNLEEDKKIWEVLSVHPCSKLLPATSKEFKKYQDTGTTISQRIFSKRADYFNITDITQVTRPMIAQMARLYLECHELLQLEFCRDPSRQSIDEEVQIATLKHYLSDSTVAKPNNGTLTLFEGDIIAQADKSVEARSIDITVTRNQKEFYIFAKYSAVSGSGQTHQADESKRFIKEAIKYVDKHKDGKYFVILMDGAEAESHLPEFNDLIEGYPTMFAGNCEDVINFVTANS